MICVIGDSHVDSYVSDFEALFSKRWLGAATAHGLINGKNWNKIEDVCSELNPETDVLVLCFGEIDCRIHIFYHSLRDGRSCESLIEETVVRYLRAINCVKNMGFRVSIIGIMPASRQGNFYGYPYYGDDRIRARISRAMNERLKKECEFDGIAYFDLYDLGLAAEDDLIRMDVLAPPDLVHINPQRFPIKERFREWVERQ